MKFLWSLLNILLMECLLVWSDYRPSEFQTGSRLLERMPEVTPKFTFKDTLLQEKDAVKNIVRHTRNTGVNPVSLHQRYLSIQPKSRKQDNLQKFEEAEKLLAKRATNPDFEDQICEIPVDISTCRKSDKFRTFDGSCNNLRNPSWGMATACYQRFLVPDYADGVSAKRVAKSGKPLPSPRKVSLNIHFHWDRPSKDLNHLFMTWGQFVDHDIALTPLTVGPNNELINCCPVREDNHASCDPIIIGKYDPFYRKYGVTCLSNVRSARCLACTSGPREQINQVTSYIDGSHIYGNEINQSRMLRNNDGSGVLKYVKIPEAGELPPGSNIPEDDECSFQDETYDCFQTGDVRVNQHPAITSLHTIFLREHNRIARILGKTNPSWDGERIFQESRRIVGAELQMVTYKEYLPLVIGPNNMDRYDLAVRYDNRYTEYDEELEGTLGSEFTTAAFRFGHSMINSYFHNSHNKYQGYYLKDRFNYPFGLYKGHLDGIVKGMTDSPSQKCDRFLVPDVRNHLFQGRGNKTGLDLAALNVNRGRDHGIPGYTTLLRFCEGPEVKNWYDLKKIFGGYIWIFRFKSLYEHVDDIDLFSGGLAEHPDKGAVVGHTFACIIGRQFKHLKYGDRFYFEHGGQTGSFTPAQLKEIKKVTLGRIICDNSKINELPKHIFFNPNFQNEMEHCEEKPRMDLNAWKE